MLAGQSNMLGHAVVTPSADMKKRNNGKYNLALQTCVVVVVRLFGDTAVQK